MIRPALLAFLLTWPAAGQAAPCGETSPAMMPPECVTSSGAATPCSAAGAIRLWPARLQPFPPGRVAADRDSTDRIGGTTVPGAKSGHELFKSIRPCGPRCVVVAYNAGFLVFDIESTGFVRGPYRDGWMHHFFSFPPVSEQLTFIESVDVVAGQSGFVVVLSGKDPVGPSIWTVSGSSAAQAYQDIGTSARQVATFTLDGRSYFIAATPKGATLYGIDAALGLPPCLDDAGSRPCGHLVYRGKLPGLSLGRYASAAVHRGQAYAATSDGFFDRLRVWRLDPERPARSTVLWSDPGPAAGTGLFEHGGTLYLAVAHSGRLVIYSALDGTEVISAPIPLASAEQFVTASPLSPSSVLIYVAVAALSAKGKAYDRLFEFRPRARRQRLANLAESATYTDPCNGLQVDYLGEFNPGNSGGPRGYYTREGAPCGDGKICIVGQTVFHAHSLGPLLSWDFEDGQLPR